LYNSIKFKDEKRKKYAPLGTLFEASVWILLDGIISDLLDSKKENEDIMRKRHATLEQ
jgi:D-arabinose 5-phosphate isomerase GutQ